MSFQSSAFQSDAFQHTDGAAPSAAVTRLAEVRHAGEFILREAKGWHSRENVTLASGQNLNVDAVLGRISASGKYTALDQGAGDGSQSAAGILIGACDARLADTPAAIIARAAQVNGHCLDWGSDSPSVAAGIAELAERGIIVA